MTVATSVYTLILINLNVKDKNVFISHLMIIRIFLPFMLCWIIHVCHNDNFGIANKVLASRIFVPISGLSLGIFLLNRTLISFLAENILQKSPIFDLGDVVSMRQGLKVLI